jgi:hypothetical protein
MPSGAVHTNTPINTTAHTSRQERLLEVFRDQPARRRSLGGRPQIEVGLRALIQRMSMDNPLWGAPRIHGELLKLGFEIAQSSVAKYMVKRREPPNQGWRTFLRNHAPDQALPA